MFPAWFHQIAIAALLLGGASASIVLVDVLRRPQQMGVMNVVWPVTALFGTVFVVWGYFAYGRASRRESVRRARRPPGQAQPRAAVVAKGTLHCGAGCMLGDLFCEWLAFVAPSVAVAFGWHTVFDDKTFAVWGLDFVVAFALGIVFQYFAIVPMRGLSPGAGVVAALKADALSLSAWQVGMYGAMAILQFEACPRWFGLRAAVDTPEFWFAMQFAMIAGFVVAFPVNWWLVDAGLKEAM